MKTLTIDISQTWMACLLTGSLFIVVCGKSAYMQVDPGTIRENPNCRILSEKLQVTMESDGERSSMTLTKNTHADVNVPMYTSNKDGETERLNLREITSVGMYLDVTNMASMKVTCFAWSRVAYEETVQLIFEGTLAFHEREWVLKPKAGYKLGSPVQYDMEPYQLPDFGGDFKVRPSTSDTADSNTPPPNAVPKPTAPTRSKRDVTAYNVDVLAVIDYSIYSEYFDRSQMGTPALKREDALAEIRKYYAHIVNGMTLRYANIDVSDMNPPIVVSLVGYFVAEDASAAVWTEPYKQVHRTEFIYHVDVDASIESLKQWRLETTLPANDHAMLFTRYALSFLDNSGNADLGVVGYAFVGATCSNDSVSLIEESSDRFEGTTATAAHELGHILGAEHDGTGNTCWRDEKFLMWPSLTSTNIYHIWEFSHCSVTYFKIHLEELENTEGGSKCLGEAAAADADVFDVAGKRHAQDFTINEQCELALGAGSTICHGLTPLETLCGLLYCEIPGYAGFCQPIYPALGTQCGSGKWCQGGQCVDTNDDSITSDKCPLGEVATVYDTGQDCLSYIEEHGSSSCYTMEGICCSTCDDRSSGVNGCEYGDHYKWCDKKWCDPRLNETMSDGTEYQAVCCQTCGWTGDLELDENHAVSMKKVDIFYTCIFLFLALQLLHVEFLH